MKPGRHSTKPSPKCPHCKGKGFKSTPYMDANKKITYLHERCLCTAKTWRR
jgi:hypothetical protein